MKTTEKIALLSFAIGAAIAGGIYYLDPPFHWGWCIGLGAVVAGGINAELVKQTAAERIANRDMAAKN